MISHQQHHHSHKPLPKRIILVRHGESAGNLDGTAYTTTPDHQIPLTPQGLVQAKQAGERIRQIVSGLSRDWKVYFYVSPYERTRSTLSEIGRSFSKKRVIGVREECRIREQDFGNFQVEERMKVVKETRLRFGRFFYRFPEGESAADVYDRVSSKCFSLVLMFSFVGVGVWFIGFFFSSKFDLGFALKKHGKSTFKMLFRANGIRFFIVWSKIWSGFCLENP